MYPVVNDENEEKDITCIYMYKIYFGDRRRTIKWNIKIKVANRFVIKKAIMVKLK